MKNLLFATLLLAMTASFVTGCKKEKTNTEKVTGTWRVEEIFISPAYDIDGDGDLDTEEVILPCDLDDDFTVAANGTFVITYNTLCDITDPTTGSGTWAFNAAETIFTITDAAFPIPIPFTIVELTDDHMQLSFDNGTYTSTAHYHKQ